MDFVDGNGESQFRVGIPYLEDAAGEVLNDIAVSVEQEGALCVVSMKKRYIKRLVIRRI